MLAGVAALEAAVINGGSAAFLPVRRRALTARSIRRLRAALRQRSRSWAEIEYAHLRAAIFRRRGAACWLCGYSREIDDAEAPVFLCWRGRLADREVLLACGRCKQKRGYSVLTFGALLRSEARGEAK